MDENPRIVELRREYVDCIDRARAITREIQALEAAARAPAVASEPSKVRLRRMDEDFECMNGCPIDHRHSVNGGTAQCADCDCAYDMKDFHKPRQRVIL